MTAIHPAPREFSPTQLEQDPILHFFHYAHLPAALQSASAPFCDLANMIVTTLPRNAERSVALRKLLEAKDAAVRANVGRMASKTAGSISGGEGFAQSLEEDAEAGLTTARSFRSGHDIPADQDRDGMPGFEA